MVVTATELEVWKEEYEVLVGLTRTQQVDRGNKQMRTAAGLVHVNLVSLVTDRPSSDCK